MTPIEELLEELLDHPRVEFVRLKKVDDIYSAGAFDDDAAPIVRAPHSDLAEAVRRLHRRVLTP